MAASAVRIEIMPPVSVMVGGRHGSPSFPHDGAPSFPHNGAPSFPHDGSAQVGFPRCLCKPSRLGRSVGHPDLCSDPHPSGRGGWRLPGAFGVRVCVRVFSPTMPEGLRGALTVLLSFSSSLQKGDVWAEAEEEEEERREGVNPRQQGC